MLIKRIKGTTDTKDESKDYAPSKFLERNCCKEALGLKSMANPADMYPFRFKG